MCQACYFGVFTATEMEGCSQRVSLQCLAGKHKHHGRFEDGSVPNTKDLGSPALLSPQLVLNPGPVKSHKGHHWIMAS